ncbi:MAG: dihydroxyacetone kinase subunit DhaK [Synergistaceae bacterium]|jgi:dihydroxyacetone kinase-like protein|nr:dihydroxyacetone kinase subunit DhaK [Synergistaceae bacterium]
MKKLINKIDDVVAEALKGLSAAHSDTVRAIPESRVVVRASSSSPKVVLISGGGSGHEPLHCGFVGYGMLDAACAGEIFTSPTPDQICSAVHEVNGGRGVLFLVKNYSGDIMNFKIAREILEGEGVDVESVVICDDVSVTDSTWTVGRRGVGGTVFIEKIAGAYAETGASLNDVKSLADRVNANVRTMGAALTSCTVPAVGRPTFGLGDDEIELGIGIHGEPGRARVKMSSSAEIVEYIAGAVVDDLPFRPGDEVAVLVNGMGGTPLIELYIVYNDLKQFLGGRGIKIGRNLVGSYITSLDMQGVSITLLRLDNQMKELWDHPVRTPALCMWR